MSGRGRHPLIGKWRITEMDLWDADYIDMLGPGHIQFDRAGGEMKFGAVQIGLDCHYAPDSVCGDGDADLQPDGTITGGICSPT